MQRQKKKKGSTVKKLFKTFFKTLFLLLLIAILAVAGFVGYLFISTENVNAENIYERLQKTSYIYDSSNELIDTLYLTEDRTIVNTDTAPDEVKNAFVAIEDKTFYTHHGFNFKRMAGAILNKLTGKADAISGTSTITQQLARNIYLADTKSQRTIKRKLLEMIYAAKIEKEMSKEDIIDAYLNTIYLGYGCYGIDAAAETYFSKKPDELDIDEIAILAALPQAPDTLSPLKNEASDTTTEIQKGVYADSACEERRDMVLELMYEQGYISEAEKQDAKKPVADILNPTITHKDSAYTYFKDYLIQQVEKDLADKYSLTDEEAEEMVYTGGLHIYSTVNSAAQKIIVDEFSDDYNFPYNYGDEPTQAAMVITEASTGKIIAMVGGRNSSGEKLFNRATNPRQPGSAIKPLTVYSAALQKSLEYSERGKKFEFTDYDIDSQGTSGWGDYITVASTVIDEPTYINGEKWPNNFSKTYSGRQNFQTAIQQSLNTCAVKILYQVGMDYAANKLVDYGITTLVTSGSTNDINPAALGLGAMTKGITPLEMSLAYGTFPNNGSRCEPVSYTKVTDANGDILLTSNTKDIQVLDQSVAWIMTDVLKSVVSRGIAKDASIYGVQVGGKTGTTDISGDIWFAGFTPGYSAALWIGADDNSEMNTTSSTAARLWSRIMNQIPEVKEGEYKAQPENVVYYGGDYYSRGTTPDYAPRTYSGTSSSGATHNTNTQKTSTANNNTNKNKKTEESQPTPSENLIIPDDDSDDNEMWVNDWE